MSLAIFLAVSLVALRVPLEFGRLCSECHNCDDCAGIFVDQTACVGTISTPTGYHFDDYTCESEFGLRVEDHDDERTRYRKCKNIVDCPVVNAGLPGTCGNKIGDYSFSCPLGF